MISYYIKQYNMYSRQKTKFLVSLDYVRNVHSLTKLSFDYIRKMFGRELTVRNASTRI